MSDPKIPLKPDLPPRKLDPMMLTYGAALIVLAGGLGWLLLNPAAPPPTGRIDTIEQRLARVELRPAAAPAKAPDLGPLEGRLAALERRPLPVPAPVVPPVNLGPLENRLAALENRAGPDLRPLDSRLMALEQRPAPDTGPLTTRVDALAGRQDALSARAQAIETALTARTEAVEAKLAAAEQTAIRLAAMAARIEALEKRLATAETVTGQVPALAARSARLARLQAAQTALEDGKPLGEIPDAPPALARFATAAPPTEAALRLSFPAAARAAMEASAPAPSSDAPLADRLWSRAQSLVTVRQGDKVLVGDPAAGSIGKARRALEAGDLAGTVAALGELQGPAAQAVAAWRAQASALLEARAALSALAGKA